jgi:hypothetical protein
MAIVGLKEQTQVPSSYLVTLEGPVGISKVVKFKNMKLVAK